MSNAKSLGAAKAASDEATGPSSRVFVWKYTDETGEDRQLTLSIPRKYKRFKFARLLATGDIIGSLAVLVGPDAPVLEEIEDLELEDDEFELFMERLGEALGGTSAKN